MVTLQFAIGDLLNFADQCIDGYEFAGTQVDRRRDEFIAMHVLWMPFTPGSLADL